MNAAVVVNGFVLGGLVEACAVPREAPIEDRPAVRFADGSAVVGAGVPGTATAGGQIRVAVRWVPGPGAPPIVQVSLTEPGAREPAVVADAAPLAVGDGPPVVAATLRVPTEPARAVWQVEVALVDGAERVAAAPFGTRVPLGVVRVGRPAPAAPEAAAPPGGARIVVGGDVNLGRAMNGFFSEPWAVRALDGLGLAAADLAYVNLECVVGVGGAPIPKTWELGPYYFRARPEVLGVLDRAGVDVVGAANNHAGDYGVDAMAEQMAALDAMGVGRPGLGRDHDEACAPTLRRVGDLVVAFFALDATAWYSAAGVDHPGTCSLDPKDPDAWTRHLAPRVAAVRSVADLVLVGVHWGPNGRARPTSSVRALAAAIVHADVDAVMGSSAHLVQGVDVIDDRPVLYDTGNLLFDVHLDGEQLQGGLFTLRVGPEGVREVRVDPLSLGVGRTTIAEGNEASATLLRFADRSAELGTAVRFADGAAVVDLPRRSERSPPVTPAPADPPRRPAPTPGATPPPACVAAGVPEDAAIEPRAIGPLVLHGFRVDPQVREGRGLVWVETWWTAPEPVEDLWLKMRIEAPDHRDDHRWWGDHQPCDWAWPTDRWQPGVMVVDRFPIRPPTEIGSGPHTLRVGLSHVKPEPASVPLATVSVVVP